MIVDATVGINSTDSHARINALHIDARLVRRALGTNRTLWATLWRLPEIVGQTRAHRLRVSFHAFTIRTAWRRSARVHVDGCNGC